MLTIDFRYLPLTDGDLVLDLGCGEGRHAIATYLHAKVTTVAIDLSLTDLQTARTRFTPFAQPPDLTRGFYLQQADASCLPFADAGFDRIICSEVLEHLPNYHAVLKEIRRVLKPNGLLAISVPRAWPEKICWRLSSAYHQVVGGHVRIFNAENLRKEVEQQQFVFLKRHWAHALHTPFWWLKCYYWETQDESHLIKLYHRLLVWDLMDRPWLTRILERCLNPVIGKSVVLYFKFQPNFDK